MDAKALVAVGMDDKSRSCLGSATWRRYSRRDNCLVSSPNSSRVSSAFFTNHCNMGILLYTIYILYKPQLYRYKDSFFITHFLYSQLSKVHDIKFWRDNHIHINQIHINPNKHFSNLNDWEDMYCIKSLYLVRFQAVWATHQPHHTDYLLRQSSVQ